MEKKTILVVEDEQNMRDLLGDFLGGHGYHVEKAASGEEAMAVIRRLKQIDLMMLDIMMPGINGRQLMGYLRKSGLRKFPIIIVSAIRQDDEILESYLEGTDHYITKPFDLDDVLNAVEYYLGVHAERK